MNQITDLGYGVREDRYKIEFKGTTHGVRISFATCSIYKDKAPSEVASEKKPGRDPIIQNHRS